MGPLKRNKFCVFYEDPDKVASFPSREQGSLVFFTPKHLFPPLLHTLSSLVLKVFGIRSFLIGLTNMIVYFLDLQEIQPI